RRHTRSDRDWSSDVCSSDLSIGGAVAVPHLLPYSAAKFAVVGFSTGLAAETAREGIRVVTVLPGLMRTGSFGNALVKGRREKEKIGRASGRERVEVWGWAGA